MANHRYWRIFITKMDTNGNLQIREIEMRGSIGGADQCNGGVANQNNFEIGYDGSHAFDNNVNTEWYWPYYPASFTSAWISYDFGSGGDVDVAELSIDCFNYNHPVDFDLQYSDNGMDWTTARTFTNQEWSVPGVKLFQIGPQVFEEVIVEDFLLLTGNYPNLVGEKDCWRINVTKTKNQISNPTQNMWLKIYEMEMREQIGGSDQCNGGSILVNMNGADGADLVNNSTSSYWFAYDTNTAWFGYRNDASPFILKELALYCDTVDAPVDFEVQWATKSAPNDWHTARTFINQSWPVTGWQTFIIGPQVSDVSASEQSYFTSISSSKLISNVPVTESTLITNSLLGGLQYLTTMQESVTVEDFIETVIQAFNASFRYWRIYVTKSTAGSNMLLSFYEMEMRATVGGADQCNGGTASASHADSTSSNLFDNNTTSYWVNGSPSADCWIKYDFGAGNTRSIGQLAFLPRYTNQCPEDFQLQYSNDGTTWTTMQSWVGQTTGWSDGTWRYYTVNRPPINELIYEFIISMDSVIEYILARLEISIEDGITVTGQTALIKLLSILITDNHIFSTVSDSLKRTNNLVSDEAVFNETSKQWSVLFLNEMQNFAGTLSNNLIIKKNVAETSRFKSVLASAVFILRSAADGLNLTDTNKSALLFAIDELQTITGSVTQQGKLSNSVTGGISFVGNTILGSAIICMRDVLDGLSIEDANHQWLTFVVSELETINTNLHAFSKGYPLVTGDMNMTVFASSLITIFREAISILNVNDSIQGMLSFAINELQAITGSVTQQGKFSNSVTGGMAMAEITRSLLKILREVTDGLNVNDYSKSILSFTIKELQTFIDSLATQGHFSNVMSGSLSLASASTSVFRILKTVLESEVLDDENKQALAFALNEIQDISTSVETIAKQFNTVTGILNFKGTVSLATKLLQAVIETALLVDSPTIQAQRMILVLDRFSFIDSLNANLIVNKTATGAMSSADAVKLCLSAFVQDMATLASAGDGVKRKIVQMAESLVLSGATDSLLHAQMIVAAVLTLQDDAVGNKSFYDTAIEDIVVTENLLRLWVHNANVMDTMLFTDSVERIVRIQILVTDDSKFHDTSYPGAIFNELIADGVKIFLTFSHDDDAVYSGFVVNTNTFAVSEYTNFRFNSLTTWNGKVYAANSSGIFVLSDKEDDDGLKIQSIIRTGIMNFGSKHFKRVNEAFVGIRGNGQMILKTITGDATEHWYDLKITRNNTGENRIKLGRGVSSLFWQFELHNTEGNPFELTDITLYPVELSRRER
ncbi:MAG: discoidin domain-containing protein [Magnetococcus sp. YQC-5]